MVIIPLQLVEVMEVMLLHPAEVTEVDMLLLHQAEVMAEVVIIPHHPAEVTEVDMLLLHPVEVMAEVVIIPHHPVEVMEVDIIPVLQLPEVTEADTEANLEKDMAIIECKFNPFLSNSKKKMD